MPAEGLAFSRERLAGYDPERLREAKVVVVGAGALGQNSSLNLALSGIGEIRLVDADEFEGHNRTRSPFYPLDPAEGFRKVVVVARRLAAILPEPNFRVVYADSWIEDLGDGAFADADAIVSAVDSDRTRAYLCDRARLLGIPLVEGGFHGTEVGVSRYANDRDRGWEEPCWLCSNPEPAVSASCALYAKEAEESGIIPAIQSAASFDGALVAEAAMEFLHGRKDLAGTSTRADVRDGTSRRLRHTRDPLCPGVHRFLEGDLPVVAVAPNDRLGDLVAATTALSSAPLLLPSPLLYSVGCRDCGHRARFAAPAHRWRRGGRCADCGGCAPRCDDGYDRAYTSIAPDLPNDVLDLTLFEAGLNYGSVLPLDHSSSPAAIRLSGNARDLFIAA